MDTTDRTAPDEDVIRKLRKLIAVEEGKRKLGDKVSMAEAELFAEKIHNILMQHNLSMSDVKHDEYISEDIGAEVWNPKVWGAKAMDKRSGWREELAVIVAHAHFCRILVTSGSNTVYFVGRHNDRVCALYAYGMLVRFAERQSRKEARKARRKMRRAYGSARAAYGWRSAWLSGFNLRIASRYREMELSSMRQAEWNREVLNGLPGDGPYSKNSIVKVDEARRTVKDWLDRAMNGVEDADELEYSSKENMGGLRAGYEAGGTLPLDAKGAIGGDSKVS